MSWRDIVTTWLSNRRQDETLSIVDLVGHLVRANVAPTILADNATLHSILLTQIMLETLNGITVPPAPQGKPFTGIQNFTYIQNSKEIMMWDLNVKNSKEIKLLEEKTGVNLDHYHKLNIENKWA